MGSEQELRTKKALVAFLSSDPSGQELLNAIRGAMEALEACIYADWKDAEDGAKASLAALKKAMGDV